MSQTLYKIVVLGANAMAAVMDFGVGALIAVSLTLWFDAPVSTSTFLLGGVLALLPDFDVVPRILRLRFVEFDHHATIFHRPLALIAAVSVVAGWLGGWLWVLIATACLTYHYLHDTAWSRADLTSGISWLWPFSTRCVAWWGLYDRTIPKTTHKDWIETYWLQPTYKSVTEIAIGLGALGLALLISGHYSLVLLGVAGLIVCGSAGVWLCAALSVQTRPTKQ